MAREHYPPVWKDLAWGRIRKGDEVNRLVQKHPPLSREDFGPYTHLSYLAPGSPNTLEIIAKDGRLIGALAGSRGWQHVFFGTPEEEKAFSIAYSAYTQKKVLEGQAFPIHRAITGGQDIFLARLIERRKIPKDWDYSEEMVRELKQIYGQEYLDAMRPTKPELTVEVTRVLYGDLQVGAVLTFAGEECDCAQLDGPDSVFLHFEDSRLIYPHSQSQELYVAVPKEVLDWYQSLTADQVKDFEARRLADRAKREALEATRK